MLSLVGGLFVVTAIILVAGIAWPESVDVAWTERIRISLFAAGGAGAFSVSYVAYRKQRTTEQQHVVDLTRLDNDKLREEARQRELLAAIQRQDEKDEHQELRRREEANDANVRQDERDRRERYTKAVGQLGSDNAPIRLGGVYSLAQIADEWGDQTPELRQTCVDILCTYLRMPWPNNSASMPPIRDADGPPGGGRGTEELRVREAILQVIGSRVTSARGSGWQNCKFDLSYAELPGIDFSGCTFRSGLSLRGAVVQDLARLDNCRFEGQVEFSQATFVAGLNVRHSLFCADADITDLQLIGPADFEGARFEANLRARIAVSKSSCRFKDALFVGRVDFTGSKLQSELVLDGSAFASDSDFGGCSFGGPARFAGAYFHKRVTFTGSSFAGSTDFRNVIFRSKSHFAHSVFGMVATDVQLSNVPGGPVLFDDVTALGDFDLSSAVVENSCSFDQGRYYRMANFANAKMAYEPTSVGAFLIGPSKSIRGTEHEADASGRPLGDALEWADVTGAPDSGVEQHRQRRVGTR